MSDTATTPRRIGLLGGSFDPIHNAHLQLAESACTELTLDAVWFIPAGQPWQRDPLAASPQQRWDMVSLAIAGRPGLRACDIELKRQGPSYTIDTVRALRSAHPDTEFTFILGADQLRNLPTWNGWDDIVAQVDLAAARRPGYDDKAPPDLLDTLAAHGHQLHRLSMPEIDLSATRIRRSIAQGESLAGLAPAAVAHYIDQHRLYTHA
ncbi:nicotinate-nucleotide adenylyltransferase [Thiomonas intermedia]|uniref:nicotinate-nucleotide adenylyltransferase n=1 Tax=Thiomonas intermedia TaxID=926 RepID=UPI0009A553C9|nr:nicotinate-nucleotide adenylyltransferase [Thiomonas intermedia]